MGELVAFKAPANGKRQSPPMAQDAVILFFTGVRREFWIDPVPATKRPPRAKANRTSKSRKRPPADCKADKLAR